MASPLSKPADFGQFVAPVNLDLVSAVLQAKQQKFDHNLANLEISIQEKFGNLDLERREDKEYFFERAKQSLNNLGDLSKVDFSKQGILRDINRKLATVVDSRVINDVISTKNFRNFQDQVKNMREKNLDKFDEGNLNFALKKGGIEDWLNGKSASLGEVSLQEFTDVTKELKDIALNLDKFVNVTKGFTAEGELFFKTTKGETLTPEEVRNIAESLLSDKAKKQMVINGFNNFDGGVVPKEKIISNFQEFSKAKINEIENRIKGLRLKLKNTSNPNSERAQILQSNIDNLEDFKLKLIEEHKDWVEKGKFDSMTTFMEKEQVLGNFANTFSINNIEEEIKPNQVALQRLKIRESSTGRPKVDSEGKPTNDGVKVIDFPNALEDSDPLKENLSKITEFSKALNSKVNELFNSLDKTTQDLLESQVVNNSNKTREEQLLEQMITLNSENNKIIKSSQLEPIISISETLTREKGKYDTAYNKAVELVEQRALGELTNIVNNTSERINIELFDADGKKVGQLRDVLKDIKNLDELNANTEVKNLILQNLYVEQIINEAIDSGALFQAGFSFKNVFLKNPTGSLKEFGVDFNRLEKLVGKDKINKVLADAVNRNVGGLGLDRILDSKLINPVLNPVLSFLRPPNEFNELGILKAGEVTKELSSSNIEELTRRNLKETLKEDRDKALSIAGNSDLGKEIAVLVDDVNASGGSPKTFKINANKSISITNDTPDEVKVSQLDDNGEVQEVRILKINLPDGIKERFLFDAVEPAFSKENMIEKDRKYTFRDAKDTGVVLDIADTYFFGDTEKALETTKQGAIESLKTSFPEVFTGDNNDLEVAIKNMLNNGEIVSKIVKENGEFFKKIAIIDPKTNKEIILDGELRPIPEQDYDLALRQQRGFPQLDVIIRLSDYLTEFINNPDNVPEELEIIMNTYGQ